MPMTLKLRLPLTTNLKQRSYNAIARIIHSLNIQAMWQCELVSACYSGSFEAIFKVSLDSLVRLLTQKNKSMKTPKNKKNILLTTFKKIQCLWLATNSRSSCVSLLNGGISGRTAMPPLVTVCLTVFQVPSIFRIKQRTNQVPKCQAT